MSHRLKGLEAEELPAVMFVAVLIFAFIGSIIYSYSNYYSQIDMIERERLALSVLQNILEKERIDPNEVLLEFQQFNIGINITDIETGFNWTKQGPEKRRLAVSSAPVILKNGHIGMVRIYV